MDSDTTGNDRKYLSIAIYIIKPKAESPDPVIGRIQFLASNGIEVANDDRGGDGTKNLKKNNWKPRIEATYTVKSLQPRFSRSKDLFRRSLLFCQPNSRF